MDGRTALGFDEQVVQRTAIGRRPPKAKLDGRALADRVSRVKQPQKPARAGRFEAVKLGRLMAGLL